MLPGFIPGIRFVCALSLAVLIDSLAAAAAATPTQAEQLKIIQSMSDQLRAKINQLPALIAADQPLGKLQEQTVTLNRTSVVVQGQRFDGLVVTAPAEKATFGWVFAAPKSLGSWYITREKGDMKGFSDFLHRPRTAVPAAAELKPQDQPELTFQKLDSSAWQPGERYILWFRFTDDAPAEISFRAGFFPRPSLNNNGLPALLFPAEKKPTAATK